MAERKFIRDPSQPFVASQSAIRVLSDCERKFAHQYVWKTPQDSDYKEPTYFRFGKAFHHLMEHCDGDFSRLSQGLLEGTAMQYLLDWEKEVTKIVAMVCAYDEHRPKTERIIDREVEVVGSNWVMYADAIVEDADGWWWIVDYKSVGVALDPLIRAKLRHDPQVCLYVAHAPQIAQLLGLDFSRFGGFSYREIEKPRERQKKGETPQDFIARMKPNCRTTNLTFSDLDVDAVVEQMTAQLGKARYLHQGPHGTVQNRTKCVEKGTVCPFWSRCNGEKTYTEAKAAMAEPCDKF